MGFIAILLAAAAGIGIWMWRAKMAAEATQGLLDVADDLRAAVRRFGYRRKTGGGPLDGIDDPRLSAAGMMAAIAKLDGDYTRDQTDRIVRECVETFGTDAGEATDIAAYGRWLAQQGEPEEVIRRLARGLRSVGIDAERKSSLMAMLTRVASVEGGAPSESQDDVFGMIRRILD